MINMLLRSCSRTLDLPQVFSCKGNPGCSEPCIGFMLTSYGLPLSAKVPLP